MYPFHLGKVYREFWRGGGKCKGYTGGPWTASAIGLPTVPDMPDARRRRLRGHDIHIHSHMQPLQILRGGGFEMSPTAAHGAWCGFTIT